jgi:hypothetical protein
MAAIRIAAIPVHRCGWQKEGIKEEVYFISGKQSNTGRTRWWPWSKHVA